MVKLDGAGVITELTEIGTRKIDEPITYEDEDWGFSVSAPPGWFFYNKENEETHKTTVRLISQDGLHALAFGDLWDRRVLPTWKP